MSRYALADRRPSCRRAALATLLSALIAWQLPASAAEDGFPSKPVRVIVPYAPGGTADVVARLVAPVLQQIWKQPVVIENRSGANGAIGTIAAVRAPSDGHTLLLGFTGEMAISPALHKGLNYDPLRDLTPVTMAGVFPFLLVVHSEFEAKSAMDVVALARANPGTLTFASSGTGSPAHLAGEMFQLATRTKITHVPYKGAGPAITDLLGGHVSMFFSGVLPSVPHVGTGRLRALGVTSTMRSELLPDVPTLAESGVDGFDLSGWVGFFAPAGTPPAVVAKLHAGLSAALKSESVVSAMRSQGAKATPNSPHEFREFVRAEIDKYARLGRETGVRLTD
jgi:tripartite-type tricarboxylate transporter receptor subunit TctC